MEQLIFYQWIINFVCKVCIFMYKIFFVFIVSMDQICDAGSIYQLLISVFKSYKIRKSLACGASAITFAFGLSCRTDQRF